MNGLKKLKKKIKRWIGWSVLFFFGSTIFATIIYSFLPVPITPFMIVKYFEYEEGTFKKDWVPLSKISDELALAVIASEDQLFLDHFGFDVNAIQKAIAFNQKKNKKVIKGASTISQQTAKNVFLWPGRSWLRKGLEVYFTFLIETFWTKERILEVYLNVIEMGRGVYGAQAASKYYYKKDATKLTSWESAFIAAILPNPSKFKYSPQSPTDHILERQFWIMYQMNQLRSGDYSKLFQDEPRRE